eukprot:GHVU01004038.1.p1 GENE.GHVU01004038.1~~GHVU01004038.1.p1  ORF type:complete len:294 (+),score=31.22 GHVU01004038.1:747-1628(+)
MRILSNKVETLRLAYPYEWTASDLTGLTLTVNDNAGNELAAASAASLYSDTTLDDDATEYASSVVLADTAGDLVPGDLISITGINGREVHTVKGFDNVTKTVQLEVMIDRAFEGGAAVSRLSATIDIDLSLVTTFSLGLSLVLMWTPAGTGAPFKELARMEPYAQINLAEFEEDFKAIYPRAYDVLIKPADRLGTVLRLAQRELANNLKSRGLDAARIVDQSLIAPPLMALVAKAWTRGGDDDLIEERKDLESEYSAAFETLCNQPLWVDSDGDNIEESGEVESHAVDFERTW